jgi:hypothetical protein
MTMTKAYMMYRGNVIPVIVESYFEGGSGRYANVKAVTGYPFHSYDVQAQGDTHGAWNCNGYRVRVDFITVEDTHPADEAQAMEKRIDADLPYPVIISGGEVLDTTPITNDEEIPF